MIELVITYIVINKNGLMNGKATFRDIENKDMYKLYNKFMKKLLKDKKITNIQENDIVIE